jgi:hypothetical protein
MGQFPHPLRSHAASLCADGHMGALACAICCLCGKGSRVNTKFESESWVLVTHSNGRGSGNFFAGSRDIGMGPLSDTWV